MNNKYRVYECVNNDGKTFREHGHFENLRQAQNYASSRYILNTKNTFIINYELEDKKIAEQYYGDWTN